MNFFFILFILFFNEDFNVSIFNQIKFKLISKSFSTIIYDIIYRWK